MVYLIIMVLVAVLGIARLWLQQRREQSQMDTIDGFWSALEAMKPEMPQARPRRRSRPEAARHERGSARRRGEGARTRSVFGSRRATGLRASLLTWFVARPSVAGARRDVARSRIQARRQAREAAQAEARRRYRPPAPRQRDIAYETIDLTDERPRLPHTDRGERRRRVAVGAVQTSYATRYRSNFD